MNDISRSALCSSTTDDPHLFCILFDKSLRSILNHHAPVLQKTVTTRPRVPWINDEILTAKRYRRKAERRWRASRSTTDLLSFRLCRNRVTFLMNKARCAYYTNLVSENCLNQRKLFSACKSLLNLSKRASLPLHSNPSQLANDFGKFFRDKINSIRLEIARQHCSSGVSDSHLALYGPSFSEFRLLSETEVLKLIKSSTKTTCSLDPIPTKLLTECLDVLLTPITKLINLSLESGCFPLLWKRALVKPLLKKDGLDPIFKNYRPVSNLAYASKLVETVIAKQLQHYLFTNDLFPILQSAYQPNQSTETALLKVTNDILLNMNDHVSHCFFSST